METDPTILREGQLQRFLKKLKGKGLFSDKTYDDIYPKGSQFARMYGSPKLHKFNVNSTVPPFLPIVSSIGTYNYDVVKFLCSLITPNIPSDHCEKGVLLHICTKDTQGKID